ncbi:MAG: hypothetical protein II863_08710, partial [Kiritimatiellae bacterium]|nr:hypothetical protein [Kiritimatiellia bacterium]
MAVEAFGGDAISSLQNILNDAVGNANAGVGAAQGGVNAVLGGQGVVGKAVGDMNNQAERMNGLATKMTDQAGLVNKQAATINNTATALMGKADTISAIAALLGPQAGLVNQQALRMNEQGELVSGIADDVRGTYDKLSPIAALLGGFGQGLWNEGEYLSSQAKDIFGQGAGLVGLNPAAGGLAGEYIKLWRALSPDRFVSQAASDTQSSVQNALAQSERELARRGVSATSGAFGALQRTATQLLATSLAAAKTKARQMGFDQQAAQLDKMVSAAGALYNMGNATEQNAIAAKNAGTGAV